MMEVVVIKFSGLEKSYYVLNSHVVYMSALYKLLKVYK